MRVTNKLMNDVMARNLSANIEQMMKTQSSVSSGKRITRPSDDPLGTAKASDYKHLISTVDQYTRNIDDGTARLQMTESALDNLNNLVVRLKELAVYQSSETANAQTRSAVAEEVSAIREEIVRLANTQYKGGYIFSGYQTQTAPFDTTGTYYGDQGEIGVNVGDEIGVKVNITGDELFKGGGGGVDIFSVADGLIQGLLANDTEAIQAQIEPLDDALSQVLGFRAQVGAGLNRMETMGKIYSDFKLNTQELLSDVEDVDVVEAMTRLASEEAAYRASLETAARIMSQSLLDFI